MKNPSNFTDGAGFILRLALKLLPFLAWHLFAQVQPQLEIANGSANIGVSWPAAQDGFVLQWATNLTSPMLWESYPTAGSVVGESFVVTVQAGNPQAFFRLVPAAAPTATAMPATNIQGDSAVLSGKVNPNGNASTSAYFEYGTTTNYGMTTTQISIGTKAQILSVIVAGLDQSTLTHYRIDAANTGGVSYGPDGVFTTATFNPGENPPDVQTSPAEFNDGEWTLNATIIRQAGDFSIYTAFAYFQYGATTNYGSVSSHGNFISNETSQIGLSVSGLAASTTYHCCVVVAIDGQTSIGDDVVFRTQ